MLTRQVLALALGVRAVRRRLDRHAGRRDRRFTQACVQPCPSVP